MTARTLTQPGPASDPRVIVEPCEAWQMTLQLRAGVPVLSAVAEALAERHIEAAIIEISSAEMSPLVYVVPANSPDAEHAAWYSEPHCLAGKATVERAVMSFGWDNEKPFLHCHGIWIDADGRRCGGHLIPDKTVLSKEIEVTVWAVAGARFERLFDPETNFSLLTPVSGANYGFPNNRALLMRIKPNTEIHTAIEMAAIEHGIDQGSIHGVCSLVDCDFIDGSYMRSFASEGFIQEGKLKDKKASLTVGITSMSEEVFEGEISRDGNIICIATEILVVET
jgi:predicted DNA-binding protein with PD1-like motif